MALTDERLSLLWERCEKKRRLETLLAEARTRCRALTLACDDLQRQRRQEEDDVTGLEKPSLERYFLMVTGLLEQRLTRERLEAYDAALRYRAKVDELNRLERDMDHYAEELASLNTCEQDYAAAYEEKRQALLASGTPAGRELAAAEEELWHLAALGREVSEALTEGNLTLSTAERILDALSSAEKWATYDTFTQGGLVSHAVKHSRLDEAQQLVGTLQYQLGRFRAEIADIRVTAELDVKVEGFLRFADLFFDNIFTDIAVLKRIRASRREAELVRDRLMTATSKLEALSRTAQRDSEALRARVDRLIRETIL